MPRELLNITKAAADLADFSGTTGDEGPLAGMAGTTDHAQTRVKPVKPNGHGSGRQPVIRSIAAAIYRTRSPHSTFMDLDVRRLLVLFQKPLDRRD